MDKEQLEIPNEDDNSYVTIGDLISQKISVAVLASAIEQDGIFTWDKYGRWRKASDSDKNRALKLLEMHYEWEIIPSEEKSYEELQSPMEQWGCCWDNAYFHFGWAAEVLPDFDTIRHKQEALNTEELEVSDINNNEVKKVFNKDHPSTSHPKDKSSDNLAHDSQKHQCDIFLAMKNLAADEISITFVGDKTESGIEANNLLEISARGKTKRVPLAALDLIDLHRKTLNSQCAVLLGMIQKKKLISSGPNKKKISRLREIFRKYLGINRDPFDPYRKSIGWVPQFQIFDKRGIADERARQKAERKSISFNDQVDYSGCEFGVKNQMQQSSGSEKDAADEWLEKNDPSKKG